MNPAGDTLVSLAQLGATPISAERPGGESVRYDAEFEALRAEVAKLESPDAIQPDWNRVAQLSHGLLATRSKDLLVAGYLTVALLHRDGYPGLAGGLSICGDLVRNFWPHLFPEASRMKGRAAAFIWLAERGGQAIGRRAPTGPERDAVRVAEERLASLSALLDEMMGPESPSLGDLSRALELAQRELPPELPPVAEASAAAQAGAPVPGEIESAESLDRALETAGEWLRRAADYLVKAEPANPQGYRLARVAAWLRFDEAPPDTDGETQIPGPQPEDLGQRYQESIDRGEWRSVLEEAESRFPAAVLWLDLQRFAAEALAGLGPEHAAARRAVIAETAALAARVPRLLDLRFQNGVPFADDRTKAWLAAESGPAGGRAAAPEFEAKEQTLREARKLASSGKFRDAAAFLAARAEGATSRRERAEWRLALARLSVESGRHRAALGQLEALDDELAAASIEQWEPGLCAEVVKNLLACHSRIAEESPSPEIEARTRRLYSRLCRLDVTGALALDGKRGS